MYIIAHCDRKRSILFFSIIIIITISLSFILISGVIDGSIMRDYYGWAIIPGLIGSGGVSFYMLRQARRILQAPGYIYIQDNNIVLINENNTAIDLCRVQNISQTESRYKVIIKMDNEDVEWSTFLSEENPKQIVKSWNAFLRNYQDRL